MKKILVIGGAGFIGSHTVDLLLEKQHKVIVYDNFTTGKLSNLNLFHSQLEVIQGDILDYPKLAKEVSRCEIVLHLAALSSVPQSLKDPGESLRINSLGFVNVLQAIRETGKPIRLVYASSAAVYGEATVLPCSDEEHLISNPLSPYALQKIDNEHYAELFMRLFDIKTLGLRYFNVYGPRQDPKSPYSGVISKFMQEYQRNQPIPVFGEGNQSRDFIYVKDVALSNLLAIESDYCGIINIATGKPQTLLNLIQCIEKVGGAKAQVMHLPNRVGDILHSYGSTLKASQNLNFNAKTSLELGVRELFDKI